MSTIPSGVSDTALQKDAPHILRLPVELLHNILLVVLTDAFWARLNSETSGEIDATARRTELQLVCKHWQSAILHCPRLWIHLDLRVTTETAVRRAVKLAAAAPLWIADKACGNNAIYSSWEDSARQEAELVAGLLITEGQHISVLILDVSVSRALSDRNLSEPISLPDEVTALQYLEVHVEPYIEKAPDPLWLSILSRAPHLTWLHLSDIYNQTFWTTFANSAPISRLKYLELDGGDHFPLLDLVSLALRLTEIEGFTIWHVGITEHAGNAAAVLENARDIELPHLRYLHVKQGDSKIFGLVQKLVLPRGVNCRFTYITMNSGDSNMVLRAMDRISASIPPDDVRDLHLCLGDSGFSLYGFKTRDFHPADFLKPDLLVDLEWERHGSGMPLAFVRSVYERLPLDSVHSLDIKLSPNPSALHREIEVLRPMLARMAHATELYVDGSITETSMASVAKLLHISDNEPVPLPRLVSLSCDKDGIWCSECASQFVGDLCKLLRVRIAGGRSIARVLAQSENGMNVPDPVTDAVRALVPEFVEKIEPIDREYDGHRCFYKEEDVVRVLGQRR